MKCKILIWGASSKTLIALNMIKNQQIYYNDKKIKNGKVVLLADPILKKPNFETNIFFVNKKNDFIKYINKANFFITGIAVPPALKPTIFVLITGMSKAKWKCNAPPPQIHICSTSHSCWSHFLKITCSRNHI